MNNADGPTPAPRKPAGGEGGQRAGLGATEPNRRLLCPSPCQPVLQVNYFLSKIPAISPWDLDTEVRLSGG